MRIESSTLSMQGGSSVVSAMSIQESLMIRTSQGSVSMNSSSFDVQEFSQQGISVSTSVISSVPDTSETSDEGSITTEQELKIRMLEVFLTRLTGKNVKLQTPKLKLESMGYDKNAQLYSRAKAMSGFAGVQLQSGFGLVYNRNEIQIEKTRVSFAAEGIVKTADGREIKLNLNFNIDQEIVRQSSLTLQAGDTLKDPLVINFGGSVASFSNKTMSFDIDFDGTKDSIAMLNSGSGYLALDRNNNGIVDDGAELFGPKTDNGFQELALYDEDGNGWIDEGDSIFNHLKIWYHDEQGNNRLVALTDKNVGAIYLGSIDTSMNMYSGTQMAGALKRSGFVLLENGESRVVQELNLKI
ncbi:MAG: hypothetical protein K0Q48_1255 [Bacillota bacterium]|nr:hypothetical protein [Bacillota bacterium]